MGSAVRGGRDAGAGAGAGAGVRVSGMKRLAGEVNPLPGADDGWDKFRFFCRGKWGARIFSKKNPGSGEAAGFFSKLM